MQEVVFIFHSTSYHQSKKVKVAFASPLSGPSGVMKSAVKMDVDRVSTVDQVENCSLVDIDQENCSLVDVNREKYNGRHRLHFS